MSSLTSALEDSGAKKWTQDLGSAKLGCGSRPLHSKYQAYPDVPAQFLELSKHRETIQSEGQGWDCLHCIDCECLRDSERGAMYGCRKQRWQFPSFSLQSPGGRGWGELGCSPPEPTILALQWGTQRKSPPHLLKADDEVPVLNRN